MTYEKLQKEAAQKSIDIYEESMKPTVKGLYGNNTIWINKGIPTNTEKACILAEELGHFHNTNGDIIDQTKLTNRKQEQRARQWSYEKLIPLSSIVQAHEGGIGNRYELAEFLGVTEEFLEAALKRYQEKYGLCVTSGDYTVCFEPLRVLEMFE